jgi:hypothetical protein
MSWMEISGEIQSHGMIYVWHPPHGQKKKQLIRKALLSDSNQGTKVYITLYTLLSRKGVHGVFPLPPFLQPIHFSGEITYLSLPDSNVGRFLSTPPLYHPLQ